jgi:phage-related protein
LKEIRTRLPDKIARILFIIEDDTVYLLHGFIKKSVKIPKEDLETAHSRLKFLRSQDKD